MKILKINASANQTNSISRHQVDVIISNLLNQSPNAKVVNRDVAYSNLPYLDQNFVQAMFHRGQLSEQQKQSLSTSDLLIDELESSDIIVMGVPMYNFTIPSSLKSYFDLIARPGKTFNYTANGSMMGLLKGKTAIVVISSGGTPIGSPMDFTKDYIKTFLKFIGIDDVHFIALDQAGFKFQEKMHVANQQLKEVLSYLNQGKILQSTNI